MRRRYLFESIKNTKIVFIYAGGFQPFGYHHKQVYNKFLKLPLNSDVIITTAGAKEGDPQEPIKKSKSAKRDYFNFTEKQNIMHDLFHIDKSSIINIKNNYQMQPSIENYLLNKRILNDNDVILVWVVGEKDSSRAMPHLPLITMQELSSNINTLENRVTLEDNQIKLNIHGLGYMLISPNITGSSPDQILSASSFRNIIQDPSTLLNEKLNAFQNYFNQPFNKDNLTHMMIIEKLLETKQFEDFVKSLNSEVLSETYLKRIIKKFILREVNKNLY